MLRPTYAAILLAFALPMVFSGSAAPAQALPMQPTKESTMHANGTFEVKLLPAAEDKLTA